MAFLTGVGQFWPNFQVAGHVPRELFARIDSPVNALHVVADSIHTKKLCIILSSSEVHFLTENGHFAFLSPLWELRCNVLCSSKAQWKGRSGLTITDN